MIHAVYFWLKKPGNSSDRDALLAGLEQLRGIEVVRSMRLGVPADTEERGVVDSSFDVSELIVFDSVADQNIYQDHPIHQRFVEQCSHLWSRVLVYDSEEI